MCLKMVNEESQVGQAQHPWDDEFEDDYQTAPEFRKSYPHAHASDYSFDWEMRKRKENGLIADGVVVERRHRQDARCKILVSPSRYFARLRRQSRASI
jgi:hypothetical protein